MTSLIVLVEGTDWRDSLPQSSWAAAGVVLCCCLQKAPAAMGGRLGGQTIGGSRLRARWFRFRLHGTGRVRENQTSRIACRRKRHGGSFTLELRTRNYSRIMKLKSKYQLQAIWK